jgi:sugar lactone lactonase YvrE
VDRYQARPASEERFLLAEGPVWDPVRGGLLWVDIDAALVVEGRFEDGVVRSGRRRAFVGTVGAAVPSDDGSLVVAGHRDLLTVDPDGEILSTVPVVTNGHASRLNDGACDPAGRFLVGTMTLDARTGEEVLCRLEHDGRLTVLDDDLTLSNGLAWSPDGATLYSVDSGPGTVWSRDYDVETGEVGPRRRFLEVTEGTPDGMCSDADGNLWIAVFGAGEIRCHGPGGSLRAIVDVPVPHPTSVAFVGRRLDTLLITTARHELSREEQEDLPDAGRLFVADVGARGAEVALWAGTSRTD